MLARHRRLRGDDVRFLTGTDDNALKNVRAAEAAGFGVAEFVADRRRSSRPARAARPLVRRLHPHQRRPRHRAGVERLWRRARPPATSTGATTGPVLRRLRAVLDAGRAGRRRVPRARHPPEPVEERNWFFRLSRYAEALERALESGALAVEPETPAQRGARFPAGRARGLQRLAPARPRRRLGDPGARTTRAGDLRVVRRAGQLRHRARLRRAAAATTRVVA